jgi:hypothetical protein
MENNNNKGIKTIKYAFVVNKTIVYAILRLLHQVCNAIVSD